MPDDELKQILEVWKAPSSGPGLDRLVRESWALSIPRKGQLSLRVVAVAALVLIAVCVTGIFAIEHSRLVRYQILRGLFRY